MEKPRCPYCGEEAVLKDSKVIYRRSYGMAWICWNYPQCDAYVGCHKGTDKPLGRLANKELREAKKAAHAAFDPLWLKAKDRRGERHKAYAWLAESLGIERDDCHIGMFDVETCKRVVALCHQVRGA